MKYNVKEIFYSLQGEGLNAGKPAIFIRFIGCNLWSGREADRQNSKTICHFCDTDFVAPPKVSGGLSLTAVEVIDKALSLWPQYAPQPFVIFTGGEPLLQLDSDLCCRFHELGAYIACETNGSIATDLPIDWLTVSPKVGAQLKQTKGQELKVVFPQKELDLDKLSTLNFSHFLLQPCANAHYRENLASAIAYCQEHPKWRLSVQLHKIIGVE